MSRALSVSLLLLCGCFKAWDVGGPWACADGGCPAGLTCDDAVCCVPGGSPECPTLPNPDDGTCPLHSEPAFYFRDQDGDGAGNPMDRRGFCRAPVREAWVLRGDDCDDTDPAVGPLATERCNAVDDDCDGTIDDGLNTQPWYVDADGDGLGVDCGSQCFVACVPKPGMVARGGDCDDGDPARYPGAPEKCSGVDENCNGLLDDAPFADVQNPGEALDPRFSCMTGQRGVCAEGSLQCVVNVGGASGKACVPIQAPSTDVCGDGLDTDCSGVADDAPGCGGPKNLLTVRGARIDARAYNPATPTQLVTGCYRGVPNGDPMSWLDPTWVGNTGKGSVQVWSIDAPQGQWWDLGAATTLRLPIDLSTASYGGGGVWEEPHPIVQLCGATDAEFFRYTPAAGVVGLDNGQKLLTIPLAGSAQWARTGNALDLKRVSRIELIVRSRNPNPDGGPGFTLRIGFQSDAGVLGFP